jgi:hypothetical protein
LQVEKDDLLEGKIHSTRYLGGWRRWR